MTVQNGITHLSIQSFRNIRALELLVKQKMVVLTGENGAGKTNVLEAISFFSPGKGLRRAALAEPVPHQTNAPWGANISLNADNTFVKLGTGLETVTPIKRLNRKSGDNITQKDLWDYLSVVWLSPSQDGLFLSSPSDRRAFLDRMVFYTNKGYLKQLKVYEKLLRERNNLLKNAPFDKRWMEKLTGQLAEAGAHVTHARMEFVMQLNQNAVASPLLFEVAPKLNLRGTIENNPDAKNIEQKTAFFWDNLREHEARHIEAKTTLHGPHKSDFIITHPIKNVTANQCSTGEQKMLLCWLVLQFINQLKASSENVVILLLDDIISHLDAHHRELLVNTIAKLDIQTWFTGTESFFFEPLQDKADFFALSDGKQA